MGSINLIAARRAEHLRLVRITRILTLACLGAFGTLVGVFTFNSARLIHANMAVRRVEADLDRLRPSLERIKHAQAERLALQPKLVTLTHAQTATERWYGVLDTLKQSIPANTWLTSLVVEGAKDSGQSVRFNGVTEDQKTVGETMLRLHKLDYYQDVTLHYTQANKIGEHNTVQFELAAHLKPLEGVRNEAAQAQTQ